MYAIRSYYVHRDFDNLGCVFQKMFGDAHAFCADTNGNGWGIVGGFIAGRIGYGVACDNIQFRADCKLQKIDLIQIYAR